MDLHVEFELDPACTEPVVIVRAAARDGQVEALLRLLAQAPEPLTGWQGERAVRLDTADILRIYAGQKEVYAQGTDGTEYLLRQRLYELEERLRGTGFVRISNSEIVDLGKVTALDLTLTGTIKLTLRGGGECWVSRRYVKKLKEALGL